MQLLLVRHGESEGNITQSLQGRDDPLTARGREQAGRIAAHLARRGDIHTIYASPLARALETSRIIGAAIGREPQLREGLAEIDVGDARGMRFKDWTEQFPEEARRFHTEGVSYTFPGGESARQLGVRVATELERIIAAHRHDDGAVVVVSHGGALAWAVGYLLREPTDTWPSHQFDNCSLTEVAIPADATQAPAFLCRNEVGHLAPSPDEEVAAGHAEREG